MGGYKTAAQVHGCKRYKTEKGASGGCRKEGKIKARRPGAKRYHPFFPPFQVFAFLQRQEKVPALGARISITMLYQGVNF
jgi:hypothetical protein